MFMTAGESLTSWVLLIEQESYLPSGPYLGRIASEKRVSVQNEKRPNRDIQNYFKSGIKPITLYKTNSRQMTPVGNAYISYTQTFPQKKFLSQKIFSSC